MNSQSQKKISCAIIGAGAFGKHYIRILHNHPRAILSAVASPSVHTRTITVSAGTKLYTDFKKILEDPSIDAIVIATPVSTHAKIAIAAIMAGKHVLLEKPLAVNYAESVLIERAVTASDRVFMLGHQYLYNDYINALKGGLEKGLVGNIQYVHAEQLYPGPIRHDSGCFAEAATHEIALLDYLFAPGLPVSVRADAIDLSGGTREDFAAATIRYESGLFAHIIISSYSPIKSRRMIFGGKKGMALFDDAAVENKVAFFLKPFPETAKEGQRQSLPIPEGETITPSILAKEPLTQEVEHFFNCIQHHKSPRSDIAHGMRVARVLDAVSQALATNRDTL